MNLRLNCLAMRLALWILALALFPIPPRLIPLSFQVEVLSRVECVALPPRSPRLDLSARVLTRLVEAESREFDAWFRDDYRVARVTVALARDGSSMPHVEASYRVLGLHPDRVWPMIEARREVLLGADYEKFFGEASSPKKPVRAVGLEEFRRNRGGRAA